MFVFQRSVEQASNGLTSNLHEFFKPEARLFDNGLESCLLLVISIFGHGIKRRLSRESNAIRIPMFWYTGVVRH